MSNVGYIDKLGMYLGSTTKVRATIATAKAIVNVRKSSNWSSSRTRFQKGFLDSVGADCGEEDEGDEAEVETDGSFEEVGRVEESDDGNMLSDVSGVSSDSASWADIERKRHRVAGVEKWM